ncbi:Protein of unknown function [Flagellimonas taeanensis]|uniref:GmrSD restriction endonucleases N-terminal domain-containing protein n=1 Tax=Flagellimonas taeanensis TaxID=1005926 RepID=A0A1M7CU69_9FLAO|nr:DUF262 domain-containing protein [Allomuricauda taeanensis]SFC66000.1 Protein of unknown function [Allomuricauda taeanensis]SHL70878.1 Protein of unknown function [Allomuricauda taeanensis]
MENLLELKTVSELNQYSFFVPSYQRGYKWTKKEVNDLLNDINEFKPRVIDNSDEKTWYCLQPIVVKEFKSNSKTFEVIDGQQRLTTIYLILHYLNQDFVESRREKLFYLEYQTRRETSKFLEELDETILNDSNSDFFHISQAYQTISKWFDERRVNFDKQEFGSKFKYNSKVIWYESKSENPISIFTRINIGKIPLTNSELIKALFLNSSNFMGANPEQLRLKQLEISTEWDSIEHSLQNDRLWYFLTGDRTQINRIEFIFNLMNEEKDNKDPYSTFRYFSGLFKNSNQKTIEVNWKTIKGYYQRFSEWYSQRVWYHKIGFLITVDEITIEQLYKESNNLTKKDFGEYLDNLITTTMKNIELENLQYLDKKEVRKVLILYNILTMLNSPDDNSYFPFNLFKTESWDIEHITSIKDAIPDKNRSHWLNDAKVFIDVSDKDGDYLKQRAEECNVNDEDEFKSLFQDIVSHFNSELGDDAINDISNLTLLDSETNRGYKNAVFPLKRKTIINRDKSGVFIPICTKNVFLKYFSEYPPKISFWTEEDRENYESDLYSVLDKYLTTND